MPTKGGRTAHRFATDLFATSPIKATISAVAKRAASGTKIGDRLCVAACSVFCDHRDVIATEMIKARPDIGINIVRESLTDISIANDFLDAGQCDCKCKLI